MLYQVARFLQLAGLIIVPIAISGNLAERNNEPVLDLLEEASWLGICPNRDGTLAHKKTRDRLSYHSV